MALGQGVIKYLNDACLQPQTDAEESSKTAFAREVKEETYLATHHASRP